MKNQTPRHEEEGKLHKGKQNQGFPVVGVGASAGGLEAFRELLQHLPTDTGMGFVLVQHLDPLHESALTQLLSRATAMPVREVTDNSKVAPNHVYVIPPNTNLTIVEGRLKLHPRQQALRSVRSIDGFFEALAQDQREQAIGVILSGTASDGVLGLEAIKAEDGITFAQNETAKYDSMPRSAIAAGCVDFVLSPKDIAKELARIAQHPFVSGQSRRLLIPESSEDDRASATEYEDDETPLPAGSHGTAQTEEKGVRGKREMAGENGFKKILLLLRNHCGVDFSLYKSTTIQRRITRRMVLGKHDSPVGYADFLRGNAKELNALYSDVLISVTSFFRNPDAFDVLARTVFPKLLQQRGDDPLRIWVLGCSTGQEVYSLAMAFVESAENAPRARKLQIFATDLNDALLEKARHGLYAKTLVEELSPERMRRFFVEEEAGYRIVKPLREMVVFARQNLIGDPPFSRMDLISCRNLLIYLEPSLQKKAIPTFHYALKPGGFLFLGASESISSFPDLFEPADKKHKIYVKKSAPTPAFHLPLKTERGEYVSPGLKPRPPVQRPEQPQDGLLGELNSQREADRVTVNRFAPPGVLINADLQILQFRGATGAYLQPPPTGKATLDVLKMAREGLMLPLRAAINKAKKDNTTARREQVRVDQNGSSRTVNVEVIPLKNLRERCFLIVFEDEEKGGRAVSGGPPPAQPRGMRMGRLGKKEEKRSHSLESELSETRDYLQSIQEQHEAANEELQASNEEVQSANEELQSVNEELETSKEELESANEELTTVNEEMAVRNTELSRLNADLSNLHVSVNMAILVLARNLTIRRFTAPAAKLFNLVATDIGRSVAGLRHNLIAPADKEKASAAAFPLEDLLREVIDTLSVRESEVRDKDGRWYVLRARPYMMSDNKIDGAVLVLADVTDLKRSEQDAIAVRDYVQAVIRTVRDPLIVLRGDLCVNTANEAFYTLFKTTSDETEGLLIYDLGNKQWDIPKLRVLLEDVLPRNSVFNDFEVTHDFPHIGRRTMLLNARRLHGESSTAQMILLAIEDVTERLRAEADTRLLAAIVTSSSDAIIGKDLNGIITSWNNGAEKLFGYREKEAIGRPVTMLIPPDRLHEESEILETLKRGDRILHFETVRVRKNGSKMEVSLTISPIKDGTHQVIGASKIVRDITALKQAAARVRISEIRFRRLFETSHSGVLIVDSVDRTIIDANPFILELLGYRREELLGKELWQIGLLKDEQASHAAFRELQQNGGIRYDHLPLQTNSRGKREVEVVANRYEEDGKTVIQCSIRDITERKQAEEALAKNHADLHSHMEELSRFNNAAVGRELRMIELKKEINELCRRHGEPARYPIEFEQDRQDANG